MDFATAYAALPVVEAARFLVGQCLVREHPEHGRVRAVITETEAYHQSEPAAHSAAGRTARTWPMFERAGVLYVYLSYGLHHCLNVSAEGEGVGAAVLFRRLVPLPPHGDLRLGGPGLVGRGLAVDLGDKGLDLLDPGNGRLWLEPWEGRARFEPAIQAGTRIGITKAADLPWRFFLGRDAERSIVRAMRQG